jgi:hypothetical protein
VTSTTQADVDTSGDMPPAARSGRGGDSVSPLEGVTLSPSSKCGSLRIDFGIADCLDGAVPDAVDAEGPVSVAVITSTVVVVLPSPASDSVSAGALLTGAPGISRIGSSLDKVSGPVRSTSDCLICSSSSFSAGFCF